MSTELDKIPDNKKLGPADFAELDKLILKMFTPEPPPVGRITTPPNYALEQSFFDFMMVAKKLKGDSCNYPTMGQVRTEMKRQKAERDAKNLKLYGRTYND
jgi:hypothetical protein